MMPAVRLIALACLVVLAACSVTKSGQGPSTAPASPSAAPSQSSSTPRANPAVLGFRKVIQTEPTDKGTSTPPSSAPSPDEIRKAKAARQNPAAATDQAVARAELDALDCAAPDPLRGHDDPALPLITCDPVIPAKYVLGPAFLTATEVRDARAELDPNGANFVVNLSFTAEGARAWADFTTQNVGQQVAVVIDTAVVSAPTIQEAIVGGDTVISGGSGGFTRQEAEDLAARLRSR